MGKNTTFPHLELSDWTREGGASDVREGDVYCVWNLKASDSLRWCVAFSSQGSKIGTQIAGPSPVAPTL